jgi:hypothetical protein
MQDVLSDSVAAATESTKSNEPSRQNARWAVLLLGGPRTYAYARASFMRHVVQVVDPPMDIFSYTFYDKDCVVDAFSLNKLEEDSTRMILESEGFTAPEKSRGKQTRSRYLQQAKAMRMVEKYAAQQNKTYEYVILTRPDLVYSHDLDVEAISESFNSRSREDSIMVPECCKFGGICDRFSISTFKGMHRMLNGTYSWAESDKTSIWEQAFASRLNFTGMEAFDVKESYSFATLRVHNVEHACNVTPKRKDSWVDSTCFRAKNVYEVLETDVGGKGACSMFNKSDCRGSQSVNSPA